MGFTLGACDKDDKVDKEECIVKWEELDTLIEQLDGMVNFGQRFPPMSIFYDYDWKAIWMKISEIHAGFKGIHYPQKELRQKAWARFKVIEKEAKYRSQRRREDKQWKSEELRADILYQVRLAKPCDLFGFVPTTADDMKTLGKELTKAGEMLSKYKENMLGEHKQECFKAIQETRQIHDEWWSDYKEKRGLVREQARERYESWRTRVQMNLEKNHERYEKASSVLENLRAKADELRSDIDSAWNEEWASRRIEWLSEIETRIENIEAFLEKLEEWIEEDKKKLAS